MSDGQPTFATDSGSGVFDWSVRAAIVRHKAVAAVVALFLAFTLAFFLIAALGPHGVALADSSSCQEWSSANQTAQLDYARLYLRENPSVPHSVGTSGVLAAINKGCLTAFNSDEETTVTVLDAIDKHY